MLAPRFLPRALLSCAFSRCVLLLASMLAGASMGAAQAGSSARPVERVPAPGAPRLGVAALARSRAFLAGRQSPGFNRAAALSRARAAYARDAARPRASALGASWTPVGPGQVASAAFGNVTGRVTAIAIDPADRTGNTVYLGTTGGGVWKSTNAAGPAAAVSFTPLTDTLPVFAANAFSSTIPSLSIGALAVGAGGLVLAGTGDANDALDSYYGAGILRSNDGGATWTLGSESMDGVAGSHSFFGLGAAAIAFSSTNPSLVVAAFSQAVEGDLVDAAARTASVRGLYVSTDAGLTWQMASIFDGSQPVQTPQPFGSGAIGNAATAVVWNPVRQRFFAAVRFHGFYESADGATWTRLAHQPGSALTLASCPTNPGGTGDPRCPIFRGALAVEPVSGDMFALAVDANNGDTGLFQDVCTATGTTSCAAPEPAFATTLDATPLEGPSTGHTIAQGDYNLTLAAAATPAGTTLYAGTVDLFRCTLAPGGGGCALRNTTNALNGCANTAAVAPAEHALALVPGSAGTLLFLGNDGGLYRSGDGANVSGAPCSPSDASHFDNLNGSLGSLAEVVSFAQDPTQAGTLLTGLGALGTAGTGNAAAEPWPQLAAGEGGTVAIDANNAQLWYLSTGAGVSIARCAHGAACTPTDFAQPVPTIGETQVENDDAAVHAPWLLDPGQPSEMLIGTCRAWRGPAADGTLWTSTDLISRPFGVPGANGCSATFPVTRSLAAAGPVATSGSGGQLGSTTLYAGIAGTLDGGEGFGGHIFRTNAAGMDSSATVWTDLAGSPVLNDSLGGTGFNPGGFDISSVAADTHDATGATLYATVMGFAANGTSAPHIYRTIDAGAHWTNITANLPEAPANSVVVDPNDANTLYIGLDTGVYVTTAVSSCASSNCWSVYGTALPNAPIVELLAAAGVPTGDGRTGILRAATYGRGIWSIPLLTASTPAAPAITLNPSSATFGPQSTGTVSTQTNITVTNTGSAPLTVSSVIASGDFTETDTCIGTPIVQGASCSVEVSFAPTAAGTRAGVLTVYGNVAGGQATAALTGTGTPPAAIVLTPLALTFPATSVGGMSAPQFVTISNTGDAPSAVQTPVVNGDFKITANTCGSTLAPQTGCTIGVAFAPTGSGSRSGALTVVDDAGTQVATLLGQGTSPATDALSPVALSFTPQVLNTRSSAQPVTITNAGDVPLTLIAAAITAGDFAVTNSCGNSLAPHSSCSVAVVSVPKSLGAGTGTLTISDEFRAQTVALSGFGIAPPGVSLSPANGLNFPAIGVGTSAPAQIVTLTNNGGVPLNLAGVQATGDFAIVPGSNSCGSLVAPNAVCTIGIVFTPLAAGPRAGQLTLLDDAANAPQGLPLTGTGIDFALNPDGPTSATIASGSTATYLLLLRAPAGVPGQGVFTCAGVPVNALCTVNPGSASLPDSTGGTVLTVTVATGVTNAELKVPALPMEGGSSRPVWCVGLLPLALLLGRARLRSRRFAPPLLLVSAVACLLLPLGGCMSGRLIPNDGSTPVQVPVTTPAGNYTLTIAGSSSNIVRTVNLTLTVK